MKLNIYIFRNAVLECTGNPQFDDHEPDIVAKQLERQLMTANKEKAATYSNTCFYHLGFYDDETMRFEPLKDPVLILDCNLVLEKAKVRQAFIAEAQKILESEKKEVKKDGKSN